MKTTRPATRQRVMRTPLVALILATVLLAPNSSAVASSMRDAEDIGVEITPEPLAVPAEPAPEMMPLANTAGPASTQAEQMVMLVNQLRAQNTLPPLKADPALIKAGQDYAIRMSAANFFGHNDPDFGCNKPSERAVAAGYANWNFVGENLAAGYASPQSAFNGLANSSGHLANMLTAGYREIGVGYVYDANDSASIRQNGACPYTGSGGPYRHYWSQSFGARYVNGLPHLPVIINAEAVTTTQRAVSLYVYGGLTGQTAWAKQMRFSNDGTNWGAYEAWSATHTHTLTPGSGYKTVYAQLINGAATQIVSDTVYLIDSGPGDPILNPTPIPSATPAPGATPSPVPALPANMRFKVFVPIVRR